MARATKRTSRDDELRAFIERVERLEVEKKSVGEDIKVVYAEAAAAGFDVKTMRASVAWRRKDANDRAEQEAKLESYLHALGERSEAPLFKLVGALSVDPAMREQVIDAFKLLAPAHGEIIVKSGPIPVRIWRDADGEAQAEDYIVPETPAPAPGGGVKGEGTSAPAMAEPVIDVDTATEAQAAELGRRAARSTGSLADNPYGGEDARHEAWASAWAEVVKSMSRGKRR